MYEHRQGAAQGSGVPVLSALEDALHLSLPFLIEAPRAVADVSGARLGPDAALQHIPAPH